MMMMLRDDRVIVVYPSADAVIPDIEAIDIENGEYKFCDERGQRYVGKIKREVKWCGPAEFIRLEPEGTASFNNALELIEAAAGIEPNEQFPTLESLRRRLVEG